MPVRSVASGLRSGDLPPIRMDNATVSEVISHIEKVSDYVFVIADDVKPGLGTRVNINTPQGDIKSVLAAVLRNAGVEYTVTGNQVALFRSPDARRPQGRGGLRAVVGGTVTDRKGLPLAGVGVFVSRDPSQGTVTDREGRYTITVAPGDTLVYRFVGMDEMKRAVRPGAARIDVSMSESRTEIEEVVVSTGLFTRDLPTYTGSVTHFTRQQLTGLNNRNLLTSLSLLDPSVVIPMDIEAGSNPNRVPKIEIRGQGGGVIQSIQDEFSADPNQPLLVLNGVEVPLSRIYDLDINRIESVTILKDAGSTAIYGSRGANGVIVVETIKPRQGEYHIYYNGNYAVDTPDLSVYNLMNAAEKLEFERVSGLYTWKGQGREIDGVRQSELDKLYHRRLADIRRGVDTYWLAEPLRTAFSPTNSVRVSGGNQEMQVDVGGMYGRQNGVMKGSYRDRWGGNMMLTYRSGKFVVSNYTDITGYNTTESPYGNFSTWARANPYFRMLNEEGKADMWLQEKKEDDLDIIYNVGNPLWNASLASRDEATDLNVTNTLQVQFRASESLMISGRFNILYDNTRFEQFVDPQDTRFLNTEAERKGSYRNVENKWTRYTGSLNLSYGRTFAGLHTVGAQAYLQFDSQDTRSLTTEAEGFPYGVKGTPNTSNGYRHESKPGYNSGIRRSVGALVTFNYNYDRRYLLDLTYRIDGATTFGSNELYKPFWSVGIGWNIDRERFAEGWDWAEMLRVTATIGTAGNQNIGTVYSQSVYRYSINNNVFGQGLNLETLGAPDIPWQVNRKMSAKVEMRTMKGRLSLRGEVYREKTNPLIVNLSQLPSTGLSVYPMHLGYLDNRGVEFNVSFSPVQDTGRRIIWTISVNGAYTSSRYGGLADRLYELNNDQRANATLVQYSDGYSPSSIWAVRSRGIDPATGRELFVNRNGTLTFDYDVNQMVCVGDTRPDLEGSLFTNFRYRNLTVAMGLRYSFGGDIYNQALYDKVENINASQLSYNQDRRALYDRWKQPGDIAKYRSVEITGGTPPKTSRFVQKNNFLNATSLNAAYELRANPWLVRNLAIQDLTVSFTTAEMFRLETSKYERGTAYPFARSYSLGLSLNF